MIKQNLPYWEMFVKYASALVWEIDGDKSHGITFTEAVVDFELASGANLVHDKQGTKTTWATKAQMFKKLYLHLCKCYVEFDTPEMSKRIRTLTTFGPSRCGPGLKLRYKLMMNQGAENSIIGNLVAFHTCGPSGTVRINRSGALDHILVYKRTGVRPVVTPPSVRLFEDTIEQYQIQAARRPTRRLRYKQRYTHSSG